MEGEAYLRDGKVQRERQIRVLAHHLDGKAYNFYMQKIASDDPNNWTLHKFFTELFNYCFPVDYRQRMRLKLEDAYQKNNQPVSEYVFELQELFSMVGSMPDDMKVIKLWYSLNPRTQRAMWRDGLHPDSSTWDEVVAKAEVIEIADSVVDRRDGTRPARRGWRPGSSNNFDSNPKRSSDPASRSVTYDNRDRNNGRSHHNGQGSGQLRPDNQFRQGSTPHSRKGFQRGKSATRTNTSGSFRSAQKKSVKFADLTEKEMAQLRAEGKCFNCKETGHMSRNCPKKGTVLGNGNNKLPGVPSYSMGMTLLEDDRDGEDVLEAMPVGVIGVRENPPRVAVTPNEDWRKWYPAWQNPQALAPEQIGNCYEMTAEYQLTHAQPYPGDEQLQNCSPTNRFAVKQTAALPGNDRLFKILDRVDGSEVMIGKAQLANPKFNLGHWYAKKRARTLGLRLPVAKEYPQSLEDPVALVATYTLLSGTHSHFPNTKPDTCTDLRFFVHLKDHGSTTYVIFDNDLDMAVEIDITALEDPKFNLIEWYLERTMTEGMFREKYLMHHEREFQSDDDDVGEATLYRVPDIPLRLSLDAVELEELTVMRNMKDVLEDCAPYPGDDFPNYPIDPTLRRGESRLVLDVIDTLDQKLVYVYDRLQGSEIYLSWDLARWEHFSLGKWFAEQCAIHRGEKEPWDVAHKWASLRCWPGT